MKTKLQKEKAIKITTTGHIDWEKVRIDAAIAMLQGLNANPSIDLDIPTTSKLCVECADALVEELKKK